MSPLLDDAALAVDLVREAGALALELRAEGRRGDGLGTEQKTSASDVVTVADRAAERLIGDHLAALRPGDGLLGEEGASRPSASGRTWVIDPVDGTYNFVRGLPWWCSAVALVEGDLATGRYDVLLSAVHQPEADLIYVGGPDLPPTRNGDQLDVIVDRPLSECCVSTYLHPPFLSGVVGETFVDVVRRAETLRMLGSGTLDHLAVAQGRMDVFFQHSVAPWDWLPGSAIVRGVGGSARQVEAAGVVWSVAGVPTAVAEICAALQGR